MKISNINSQVNFGRAFTTNEKKEYEKVQAQARKELGLDKTTATIFDFSVPAGTKDTGIGTTFSKEAQGLADMLKAMCGINSIQLQPQGEISNYVRSPYSGTGFSLGAHIIDLTKLQDEKYGKLLNSEDMNSPYMTRVRDHETVDYDNVFAQDGQKAMLKKAYLNFEKLPATSPLKKEFELFKKENSYWVEKDALFEAVAVDNGTKNVKEWSYEDQNVFATKEGNAKRISELRKVKDEDGTNVVDFEEFVQFIADKQQKDAKAEYNKKGIDLYGDCQIGFSDKDVWAHKSAFSRTYEFGCDIGNGNYSCWSPAIDFDKIDGEAGELLSKKFDLFFKRYNGVRIDAAWQLINPLVCSPWMEYGHTKFDNNGNKLGHKLERQPKVADNGKHIINNIILKAADDNNVPHDKVFLELLGGNSYRTLDAVKDSGATLIHITRYAGDTWGRVKFYESEGENKYQNMKPGQYTIGPGTHDDYSLLEQAENGRGRAYLLANDLSLNKYSLEHSRERLSEAMFAELFTTKNQFATLPDIVGSDKRINTPNVLAGNWEYRISPNYEKEYHTNLAQGKGLNMPDALSKALRAKKHGRAAAGLIAKLDNFAKILRQQGPMTTKEADKLIKQ